MEICPGEHNKRLTRLRWLVFAFGLTAALLMVFVGWRAQGFVSTRVDDPYLFAEVGRNIARGDGFSFRGHPTIRRAPLYPALIAACIRLFGDNLNVVKIVQCVLLGLLCVLVFEIGRRLFTERSGLIAAALCAVHPMLLRYVADIQVETLLAFCFTLALWASIRFLDRPTIPNALLFGGCSAVAALVKGVVLLYPLAFAARWLVHVARSRQPGEAMAWTWRPLAAVFLIMAVMILPWTYRNYRATKTARSGGYFCLISSNIGGEFLRGFIFAQPKYFLLQIKPYRQGEDEANDWQRALFARMGLVWERNEVETDQVQNRVAKQKLISAPGAFVYKFVIGLFAFWYEMTTRTNSLFVLCCALIGWTFGIIGWRQARREGRVCWPLLLPILYLNVLYASLLALGRYSVPCIPALMVLAANGMERVWVWGRLKHSAQAANKKTEGVPSANALR